MAQAAPMPENVGIGALPAPNMKNMAEGGIVSFADKGLVGSALEEKNPELDENGNPRSRSERERIMAENARLREMKTNAQAVERARNARMVGLQGANTAMESGLAQEMAEFYKPRDVTSAPQGAAPQPAGPAVSAAYPDETLRGAAAPKPPARAPAPPRAPAGPAGPAPAPAAPAPATPLTIDQFMSKDPLTDPFATQRGELGTARTAAAEQAKREFETDMASRGLAGEGREKRLGERQTKLTEQTEANKNMSIMEAGFAMMQSRGRGLAGLAEGAGVGLRSYKAGIEKLTAAQERIDDARDQMDEFRRNEANMTNKERRLFSRDINDSVLKAKDEALTGVTQAYGMRRADARDMFNAADKAREGELNRGSAENIAALGRKTQKEIAAMPGQQMQMINQLGGGDFQKGYEIYKQEGAVPKLFEAYTKAAADPITGDKFRATYPTFETYKAASGMMGGGGGGILNVPDNAAGNVRGR